MVAQGTGYHEDEPHLGKLATHILLTSTTRTMRQELLAGLDSFISEAHQAYCYDFVSDWLHSDKVNSGEAGRESVALKYKDIIGMKCAERQPLVKGMDVVYIYHDTIDEAGHLEKDIFGACGEAIDELKNMVRIIANESFAHSF